MACRESIFRYKLRQAATAGEIARAWTGLVPRSEAEVMVIASPTLSQNKVHEGKGSRRHVCRVLGLATFRHLRRSFMA